MQSPLLIGRRSKPLACCKIQKSEIKKARHRVTQSRTAKEHKIRLAIRGRGVRQTTFLYFNP